MKKLQIAATVARRGLLPCAMLAGMVAAAKASTTGQITLRAVVPARAAVHLTGLANAMTIDVANLAGAATVFRLSRFTNAASGVTVSLQSNARTLHDDAGTAVPYAIRFEGKDVAFTEGTADLSSLSRTDTGDADGELEIVTPPGAGALPLADQLVLTLTAR